MKVSEFEQCRSIDEIQQLMTPSLQSQLLYEVLQLQLHLYKTHAIDTFYFHLKGVCHAQYKMECIDRHEIL